MCKDCGCGLPGETPIGVSSHHDHPGHSHGHDHGHTHFPSHTHPHAHDHDHPHSHDHDHGDGHVHPHSHEDEESPAATRGSKRTIEVRQAILDKNDRQAERNRGFFRARGLLVLNFLSSPGSGKTTFIRETIKAVAPELRAGVIVGDLATDNDAQRLRESGAPVVQITTGTVCHLEAEMITQALRKLDLTNLNLLIIENVGNLVCPASYDLGEDLRVVLLSVTEGEDKPLKYPPMFQSANAAVVTKMDLAQVCGFDEAAALGNLRRVAPAARVLQVSARSGAGMADWKQYLLDQYQRHQARDPLAP